MRLMTLNLALAAALAAVVLTAAAPGLEAQAQAQPDPPAVETFTAFALNTNSRPTGGNRQSTARLTFSIERWSTDQERDMLMAIVKEQPDVRRMNDQLLSALQGLPRVGRIRESNTLGWDLRYARQTPLPDGGRQIMLGTDRPLPFWESRNQPRSFDYRFTVLDIRLDKEHRGEGKMLADTRLIFDPKSNTIVLEQYDLQPVRLNQIRRGN
jgi:hypothetical protein